MVKRVRTRDDFIEDILVTLGHPTIKVNLTKAQINNAIDMSIKQAWKWMINASFETFHAYKMTQQDIDLGHFHVPEDIQNVVDIVPQGWFFNEMSFASPEWQLARSTFTSAGQFYPLSPVDYVATTERLYNLGLVLGKYNKPFSFNKELHRVEPFFKVQTDQFVVMRVSRQVDPDDIQGIESSLLFDNIDVKTLAVGYSRKAWGSVLSKFGGINLPGGITLSGSDMIQMADDEIKTSIDEMKGMNAIGAFLMG